MIDKIFFQIFPFVATLLYSMDFLLHRTIFVIVSFLLILPYLSKFGKSFFLNKTLASFIIMVFVGSLLNLLTTQNGIGGTINFITSIGIALFCVNNNRSTGLLVVFACLVLLFYVYDAIFVKGIDANYIFESKGQSRNYPGFLAVTYVCFWGSSKYLNYHSYPFLLPLLALVVCFFLEGRSSLGVMMMISAICLFYRSKNYIVLFLIIIIGCLIYYRDDLVELYTLTQFADKGFESVRSDMWNAYLKSLNLPSLLFGLDTLSVPILREFGGNPHNSFLNFHYRMGLLGLIALCMLIIKSLKILLSQKHFILFFYITFLLIRCFFDSCIGGASDFMIYTMLFYPILMKYCSLNDNTQQNPSLFSRIIGMIIKKI